MTLLQSRFIEKNDVHFDTNTKGELRASNGPYDPAIATAGEYVEGVSWVQSLANGLWYQLNTEAALRAATGDATATIDQTVLPESGDGSYNSDWVYVQSRKFSRNAANARGLLAGRDQGDVVTMDGRRYVVKTGGTACDDLGVSGWDSVPVIGRWHDVTQYGAGNGDANVDTDAFLRAYAAHSNIWFPKGDYLWKPVATIQPPGYGKPVEYVAECKSNSEIKISLGATLKLADNCSSDANPKEIVFLYSVSELENVTIHGKGVFDFNKDNNSLSTDYANAAYRPFRHCVLWTFRTGATNLKVKGFTVRNANGINCFVIGQPINSSDSPKGRNVRFYKLTFENCGYNVTDHTTINTYVDDSVIYKCSFYNDSITYAATCAFELHGSHSRAENLCVDGFHRAFYVGSRLFGIVRRQVVKDCIFNVRTQGGIVWLGAGQLTTEDVEVSGCSFDIECVKYGYGPNLTNYSGVTIWSQSGSATENLENVYINDNRFKFAETADEPCYAAQISGTSATKAIDLITFNDNTVINATKAFNANIKAAGAKFKRLKCRGNTINDLTSGHGAGEIGIAFDVNADTTEPPELLSITNNEVNGLAGQVTLYGSRIGSAIAVWNMAENVYTGLSKEIHKISNDQVRMTGEELWRGWASRPTFGYWYAGDIVTLSNPTAGGYAQSVCVSEGDAALSNNFKSCCPIAA